LHAVVERILLWWWWRRIRRMKKCQSTDELRSSFGPPDHEVSAGEIVFWHYPLRTLGTTLYSIHVAVIDNRPDQVYLHMEPAAGSPGR
jgi:hypothetical protein